MTGVLTAVGNRWDSEVATLLERSRELQVVRRCVDVADLVATASAGLGTVALVSAELRGLELSTVAQLRAAGLHVVGVIPSGEAVDGGSAASEDADRRLRQLGVMSTVVAGSRLPVFEAALTHPVDPSRAPTLPPGALTPADLTVPASVSVAEAYPWSSPEGAGSAEPVGPDPAGDEVTLGRIVAVWGPTGAPGRTTIAVNLAAELAVLGIRTVLVDADTYGGSVAQSLSFLDEAPGLAAATRAADQGTLDVSVLARLSPSARPGLRVVTGIPRAERWTEIRPAALERVLTLARSLGEVVVVDCGFSLEDDEILSYDTQAPRRNAATLTALELADEVLVVGGCDPVSLQRLVRGLQELGTVRAPTPTVVVNRVRSSAVGSGPERRVSEVLGRFAGVRDLHFVPDDPHGVDTALLEGRTLAECAPQSAVRPAVRSLAALMAGVEQPRTRRGRRP